MLATYMRHMRNNNLDCRLLLPPAIKNFYGRFGVHQSLPLKNKKKGHNLLICYMAESASGKDKANPAFWLAILAHLARSGFSAWVPQEVVFFSAMQEILYRRISADVIVYSFHRSRGRIYELNAKVERADKVGQFVQFSALCEQYWRKYQSSKTAKLLCGKKVNEPYILCKISSF